MIQRGRAVHVGRDEAGNEWKGWKLALGSIIFSSCVGGVIRTGS